jgi:hypothetical protein
MSAPPTQPIAPDVRGAHSLHRLVGQAEHTVMLFPWEQKEYAEHLEVMHNERRQKEFLLGSILRIAKAVNATDPVTAGELLDVIDDCTKQINRMPNELGQARGATDSGIDRKRNPAPPGPRC